MFQMVFKNGRTIVESLRSPYIEHPHLYNRIVCSASLLQSFGLKPQKRPIFLNSVVKCIERGKSNTPRADLIPIALLNALPDSAGQLEQTFIPLQEQHHALDLVAGDSSVQQIGECLFGLFMYLSNIA